MNSHSSNNRAASDMEEKARNLYNAAVNKTTSGQRMLVTQLKELYEKTQLKCVADFYAMASFNLSLCIPALDQLQVLRDLESLYQKCQTRCIAEQIGRLKFNLSASLDYAVKDLKQCAREIEQLYNEYQSDDLAEPLAKIWYSISISRAHDRLAYVRKIVDFCSHNSNPEANVAFAKVIFNPKLDIQNRQELIKKFLSQQQTLDSFQEYVQSPYYPEYNTSLVGFKLYPTVASKSLVARLNNTFSGIQKRSNSIELKAEILQLFASTLKIKRLLSVPETKEPIGHYTKLDNLKYLVLPGNATGKLRMSNAGYMNDPTEGETLLEFLSDGKRKSADVYPHEVSNTYLSSFTTAIDVLPMWSMYGSDGQGCCLVFKNNYFDYANEHMPTDFLLCENENDERNYLYRVCYLSHTSKEIEIAYEVFDTEKESDLSKVLIGTIEELKEHYARIVEMKKERDPQIDKTMMVILDQIRFLFKSAAYAHERELRFVRYSTKPLLDENSWVVPQLYVEVEKPLEYEQIIFGPKVEQTNRIAPYLVYTGKVKEIKKSMIQYR